VIYQWKVVIHKQQITISWKSCDSQNVIFQWQVRIFDFQLVQ